VSARRGAVTFAGEGAVQRGAVHAELGGDLARGQFRVGHQSAGDLDLVGAEAPRPAQSGASRSRSGEPSAGAFAHQVGLEFGERREDVEGELARGGGGVDRLVQGAQADASCSRSTGSECPDVARATV